MSGYFSKININIAYLIADKMDAEDGDKDEKISGSIWNKYIGKNSEGLKLSEGENISVSGASVLLAKHIANLSDEQFLALCKDFNINKDNCNNEIGYYLYGTVSNIKEFNDSGKVSRQTEYYGDGETIRSIIKYEYDKNNNLAGEKVYDGSGNLWAKTEYNDSGKTVTIYDGDDNVEEIAEYDKNGTLRKQTNHNNDGQLSEIIEYDEDGKKSRESRYNKEGKPSSIYEYYKNGHCGKSTHYWNGVIVAVSEYYENGYDRKSTRYDDNGNLKSVTEYDYTSGKKLSEYTYSAGRLESISSYKDGIIKRKEIYTNSGSILSVTMYDNNGDPEEITGYNRDGTKDYTKAYKDGKVRATYFDADYGTRRYIQIYSKEGFLLRSTYYRPYEGTVRMTEEYRDGYCIRTKYDPAGNEIGSEKIDLVKASLPDGIVGISAQSKQGDCYLMASINAIRHVTGGQDYLSSLIQTEGNTYTITLPGAKIAANSLLHNDKVDPDKMYITGEYTFTFEEVRTILSRAGKRYSKDDGDTILLEAAFEKYRMEVHKTMQENNLKEESYQAGVQTGNNPKNILDGGEEHDVLFIFTGAQSEYYINYDSESAKYGSWDYNEPQKVYSAEPASEETISADDIDTCRNDGREVIQTYESRQQLKDMLIRLKDDSADGSIDYIATCAFFSGTSGHAFTIKSVDEDTVTVINPWYPDKITTLDIDDFMSKVNTLTMAKMPKKAM